MKVKCIYPQNNGCSSFLILEEKTALIDVGLLYCEEEMIEKTKMELKGRPLDYIILSHSHYDHVGALSYFKKAFPEAKVIASTITDYVFGRPGAINVMKKLSEDASNLYLGQNSYHPAFDSSGFTVDITVSDGDTIDLGNYKLTVLETPGHTNCSICFWEDSERICFINETIGCAPQKDYVHVCFLKSYLYTIESIERIRELKPNRIYIQHYENSYTDNVNDFLNTSEKFCIFMKNIIKEGAEKGFSDDEIANEMVLKEYNVYLKDHQPIEAFLANAYPMINVIHKEFPEYWSLK